MTTAVLSDVHANREALEAVLADARAQGAESFVSLGDLIGFNGDPAWCVRTLLPLLAAAVQGNHEAVLQDRHSAGWPPLYTGMMDRTEELLGPELTQSLRDLPHRAIYGGAELVHASFAAPETWQRLHTPQRARDSFAACSAALGFFGHTHRPTVFESGPGGIRALPVTYTAEGSYRLTLRPGCRYLINPGSVGQPRDGDPRAAYALYTPGAQELILRRVPYDTRRAAAKICRTGLPDTFARALLAGQSPTGD